MKSIEHLRKKHATHKDKHGKYPTVRISKGFWEENADVIAELSNQGIDINVDDRILLKNTFLLGDIEKAGTTVDTVKDLKKLVDQMVEDGKGDWPLRNMPPDTNSYHKLRFYTIVPGEEPYEGLQLFPSFWGAPKAEHILVQIGE